MCTFPQAQKGALVLRVKINENMHPLAGRTNYNSQNKLFQDNTRSTCIICRVRECLVVPFVSIIEAASLFLVVLLMVYKLLLRIKSQFQDNEL